MTHNLNINVNNNNNAADIDIEVEEEEYKDINNEQYRGFAFVLNQFDEESTLIGSFWDVSEFERTLLSSPYDNVIAEDIPLIFANDLLNNKRLDNTRYYGIIGNNITMYDVTCYGIGDCKEI